MRRSSRSVEIGTRVRLLVAVVVVFLLALRFVSPRFSPSSSSSARRTAVMAEEQGRPGPRLGGVHDAPAGRENDLHTIELARFAVAEHNNKANAMLEFERLVKVRQQVVSGFMHYFTIEVKEGGAKKMYEAKVWEKAWENFKQLEEFKPVGDTANA